ncbi:MAG: NAD-dependent epimerase/dehydratase family protein [Chloroflexi bacterium]|nr:NAD-dependent epimerase/dehydratase family protein [Chloroflexota bacterium]
MKQQTILVTGGAGFVGSVCVELLVAQGYNVIVLDNLQTGNRRAVHPKARLSAAASATPACCSAHRSENRPTPPPDLQTQIGNCMTRLLREAESTPASSHNHIRLIASVNVAAR